MSPELSAAEAIYQSFDKDTYLDDDESLDFTQCKYHVQEAVAEAYLSAADEAMQIDIVIDCFHKLQDESGQEAVATTLFGSPLHGVKKLRELITGEVIKRFGDEIAGEVVGLISREREALQGPAIDWDQEVRSA